MKYFHKVLDSTSTVFKANELSLLLGIKNKSTIKSIVQRRKKQGLVIYHGHGIWSLKTYDERELASKIRKKSYIGLETVLQKEAIVFQNYEDMVTLVSDNSLEINIANKTYQFTKIKHSILSNPIGIIDTGKYMIASKERALCDRIYLTPNYYFDHITKDTVDIELLKKLSTIYNKATFLRISKLIDDLK